MNIILNELKQNIRDLIARFLASILKRFAFDPRYFELWQSHGYHIKPVHFYSSFPDTRELSKELFIKRSQMVGIHLNQNLQIELVVEFSEKYKSEYENLEVRNANGRPHFYFGNSSIESVDAEILYCMIRKFKPRMMVEIGSGFSTILATMALDANSKAGDQCEFTAIEPFPPSYLHRELDFPVNVLVQNVQSIDLSYFERLGPGDILFIDSSHVCKIGSDTQYEFLEILPRLNPGVVIHIHDIFLPQEYPEKWVKKMHRFWNEQYILQAFMTCNNDFEVLWAGSWMHLNHPKELAIRFSSYNPEANHPASFWIRRIGLNEQ
jgi:hypothetical protein